MSSAASAVPGPPVPPPLSQISRLVNVFIAPTSAFTDIKRSAAFWMPWLVMAIMSWCLVTTVIFKVGWETVQENQIKMQGAKRGEQLEKLKEQNPDAYGRQMRIGLIITKIISFTFPALAMINWLIIALIMMATLNFGAGAQAKFTQCLAVVLYASLPGLVKAALAIVFLLLGVGVETFTFQNPIASNLSFLATVGTPLYAFLSALDIFTIWILVLAGIGFSCITGVKRGVTMAMVFGWYAVATLLGVGLAFIFS